MQNSVLKLKTFVFIILTISTTSNAQVKRNYLGTLYDNGITHYLTPDSINFNREICYISKPSFISPEYSVSLETKENKLVLILRSFKSNYWQLVFSKRGTTQILVESSIDSSYIFVSKDFANKLISYFETVTQQDSIFDSREGIVYDGITYIFKTDQFERKVLEIDFAKHRDYYNLIVMLDAIANDLKNRSLIESFYLDQINNFYNLKNKKN
jgi:hypothetical protein